MAQSGKGRYDLSALLGRGKKKRDVQYCYDAANPGVMSEASNSKRRAKVRVPAVINGSNDPSDVLTHTTGTVNADFPEDPQIDQPANYEPVEAVTFTTLRVSQERKYAHLLVKEMAVLCTTYILSFAKIKEDMSLDKSSFVAIVKIGEELFCSCDPATMDVAMTASSNGLVIPTSRACMHLSCAKLFDESQYIEEWIPLESRHSEDGEEYDDELEQGIEVLPDTWLVYEDRRFGTVRNGRCDCGTHSGPCLFSKYCTRTKRDTVTTTLTRQTSISWQRIPFHKITMWDQHMTKETLVPEMCECGSRDITISDQVDTIPLFSLNGSNCCSVKSGLCSSCGQRVFVDGGTMGLLNMGNFLVTHRVLFNYLKSFIVQGLTLYAYFKQIAWDWLCVGSDGISYERLRLSWIAYQKLLDMGSPIANNFRCEYCKDAPPVIVCDGITLSFEKRYIKEVKEYANTSTPIMSGTRFSDRLLIQSSTLRKRLRDRNDVLDETFISLVTEHAPWLKMAVELFKDMDMSEIPKPWQSFFYDIGSNSPTIGLIDPSTNAIKILQTIIENDGITDTESLTQLSTTIPTIYAVVRHDILNIRYIIPVLQKVVEQLKLIEDIQPHDRSSLVSVMYDTLPCLPQLYARGSFHQDKLTKDKICYKKSNSRTSLTPGIFTVSCPHGICYGFSIMKRCESPDVPFTILRTRFNKAPEVVIYDNSCNLHQYCLNRDPGYFKRTKFAVDRFHWPNHKDCSSGYRINSFSKYSDINTQVSEQLNSKLSKLRSLVSYCNEDNFISLVQLYIWFHNTLRILAFQRAPQNPTEESLKKMSVIFTKK